MVNKSLFLFLSLQKRRLFYIDSRLTKLKKSKNINKKIITKGVGLYKVVIGYSKIKFNISKEKYFILDGHISRSFIHKFHTLNSIHP